MTGKTALFAAIVVLGAGLAGYLLLKPGAEPSQEAPVFTAPVPVAHQTPAPAAATATTAEPAIAHPLASEAAAETLPPADKADAALVKALGGVLGKKLLAFVLPDELIRHLVITIDALPRKYLPALAVPLRRASGALATSGSGETLSIDAGNAQRYAAFVKLVEAVDAAKLVAVYRHFYPLFQSAYGQLGYPQAYFNDRLVVAIDDLLAAPDLDTPIALVQPKVLYDYADPELQARSAGQKIMMRIGRSNAEPIKAKLREIRPLVAHSR